MKESKTQKRKTNWLIPAGIVLMAISITSIVWLFMRGQTVINNDHKNFTTTEDISCIGNGFLYPIFDFDEAYDKQLQINAIFDNNELYSISLVYRMTYDSDSKAERSEALNHAAMNNDFGINGLYADSYNASYSRINNNFQMNLYANGNMINDTAMRYFMLDNLSNNSDRTQAKVIQAYSDKGLKCTSKEYQYKNKEEND